MLVRYSSVVVVAGLVLGGAGGVRAGGVEGEGSFSPELTLTAQTAYASEVGATGVGAMGGNALIPLVEPSVFLAGEEPGTGDRVGSFGLKAGLGFSADPTTFLMTYQADFFLHNMFALGPLLQFGVADEDFFFAPTLNFQVVFDLPGEGLEGLKPTVQFGLGLIYLEKEHRGGSSSQVDFLTNFGIGLEYFFSDQLAIGTNMIFNFIPGEVLDEYFIYCWQVVTFRFQF
jgi:hypothetical protein